VFYFGIIVDGSNADLCAKTATSEAGQQIYKAKLNDNISFNSSRVFSRVDGTLWTSGRGCRRERQNVVVRVGPGWWRWWQTLDARPPLCRLHGTGRSHRPKKKVSTHGSEFVIGGCLPSRSRSAVANPWR
jgi:hypothetical protein